SLSVNVAVLLLDTIPYVQPKITNKYFEKETLTEITEKTEYLIADRALEMISSSKPVMVWDEPKGFTETLLSKNHITSTKEFRLHNYPRAFLYYGLSEYLIKNNKKEELLELKHAFDQLYDFENIDKIEINRIDQVPFGLTALNLYEKFNEEKYLKFSKILYDFIIESIGPDDMISYRKGQQLILNDMLGMVVPFCIKYSEYIESEKIIPIVKNQLDYFIRYGIDPETFIPAHAINRIEKRKVGSSNWGRGIGWYIMALSQYHKLTGEKQIELTGLLSSLNSLKNSKNLWSQFPGSSDRFDASATVMFLYAMVLVDKEAFNKQEILQRLKSYISDEGIILETSGDTYAINNYSNTFGKSELSQGVLLLLLANSK